MHHHAEVQQFVAPLGQRFVRSEHNDGLVYPDRSMKEIFNETLSTVVESMVRYFLIGVLILFTNADRI